MKTSPLVVSLISTFVLALPGCGGDAGGDLVMCTGSGAPIFPTFNKNCSLPTDCVIGLHQTSCCGSLLAIGLNQADKARFDADEKLCDAMYPGCGCPPAPTAAEDGTMQLSGKTIVVQCQANQCLTTAR